MGAQPHPGYVADLSQSEELPTVHTSPHDRQPLHAALSTDTLIPGLPDPIVVVGMHRSGTSVVAGMLIDLGVFVDVAMPPPTDGRAVAMPTPEQRRDGYAESVALRLLNEKLLSTADALWDYPEPYLAQLDAPAFRQKCLGVLQRNLGDGLWRGHFGEAGPTPGAPWGWKDPRTSLTLPLWLQVAPNARIIHVVRNPDSVSRSLLVRAKAWAERPAPPPRLSDRLRRVASDPGGVAKRVASRAGLLPPTAPVPPPMDDARARVLWDVYVRQCREWGPKFGSYVELPFEQVIEDPAATARLLSDFGDLLPSPAQLANAAAFVERGGKPAATSAPPPARVPAASRGGDG